MHPIFPLERDLAFGWFEKRSSPAARDPTHIAVHIRGPANHEEYRLTPQMPKPPCRCHPLLRTKDETRIRYRLQLLPKTNPEQTAVPAAQ